MAPTRIFVDTNVAIYAAGREHPLKEPSKEVLRIAAARPRDFFTDAEVLQELLHCYVALSMWPAGKDAVLGFAALMKGSIESVSAEDVDLAAGLADDYAPELSARDLLHAAVILRIGTRSIVTADKGFDRLAGEGIQRLDPADVESWKESLARSPVVRRRSSTTVHRIPDLQTPPKRCRPPRCRSAPLLPRAGA